MGEPRELVTFLWMIAIVARVRTRRTIPTPHSGRSPVVGSSQLQLLLTVHCNRWSRLQRGGTSSQEEREIADPEGGYGSQKVVDTVGDRIRFYSIIVGVSKSVRVGPY